MIGPLWCAQTQILNHGKLIVEFFFIGIENTKNNQSFEIKDKFFIDMDNYSKVNKEIKKSNYFLDLLRIHYDDNEIPKERLNIAIDAGKLLYRAVN